MNIFTIPLRNIMRRPAKALLLTLVFSLGVMSIASLYQVSQVVGNSLEKKLIAYGANIMISPKTETLNVSYGGIQMGQMQIEPALLNQHQTLEAIQSIPMKNNLPVVAPKLVAADTINGRAIALVGVDWSQEKHLRQYWFMDGPMVTDTLFDLAPGTVLAGFDLARTLNIQTGDMLTVLGRELRVSGVIRETGSDDDAVLFMDIGELQQLKDMPDAVSFVEVAAHCAGCPIEELVDQLMVVLPDLNIRALRQIMDQRMASIQFVQHLALAASIVILITAAAMVGLSMLSAVNERKKDIGLLRSLGYSRSGIFAIFCLEAFVIGAIAGVLGYAAGFGASFKILNVLAMNDGGSPVFVWAHMGLSLTVFALIAVVAAVWPAAKGARLEPSTALTAI